MKILQNKILLWLKIFFIVIFLLIFIKTLPVIFGLIYWTRWDIENSKNRDLAIATLEKESSLVPEIKINSHSFMGEGGALHVQFEVGGKGSSSLVYGINGMYGIENLGNYKTWYDCFYINSNGERTGYASATELFAWRDGTFKKWFPFEIKNLKELVENYDATVNILKTLPANPINSGNMAEREKIRKPNPDYVFYGKMNDKNVSCDFLQFQ
ncbi:hypothetical protein HY310_01265 [Candidatus Microgenomates bacterium]|nr:hypothetical protein [Candidatus Microgenomates bacterium]